MAALQTAVEEDAIYRFKDCVVIKNGTICKEDVLVRGGKILDPKKLFYDERQEANVVYDCKGLILAPGLIDIQVNGAFGHDFSATEGCTFTKMREVSKQLLKYGVTSYCPTIVTSSPSTYKEPLVSPQILPAFSRRHEVEGANILGVHLEGPFINVKKKGAHCEGFVQEKVLPQSLEECYGPLDNVCIITMAPELEGGIDSIKWLTEDKKIVVSLGHSMSDLKTGEEAVRNGASLITHLFNAMPPFHHRDPGLVGLLTSREAGDCVHYGLISDNLHTHPAAIRIAVRSNPKGVVLVSDCMAATGLQDGPHQFGGQTVIVRDNQATLENTNTLAGSVATMDQCVRNFKETTGCSEAEAIEAATLHPARVLGIEKRKGTLDYGSDADLVLLSADSLDVLGTVLHGKLVWLNDALKSRWRIDKLTLV